MAFSFETESPNMNLRRDEIRRYMREKGVLQDKRQSTQPVSMM